MANETNDRAVEVFPIERGLSKRETIASMALQGLLANPNSNGYSRASTIESAVEYADQLIEKLNNSKQ